MHLSDIKIAIYDSHEQETLTDLQNFCFKLGFAWNNVAYNSLYINENIDESSIFYLQLTSYYNGDFMHESIPIITKSDKTYFNQTQKHKDNVKGLYDIRSECKYIFYMIEKYFDIEVPCDMKVYYTINVCKYLEKIHDWIDRTGQQDRNKIYKIRMQQYYRWNERHWLNQLSSNYELTQKNKNATNDFLKNI